MSAWQRFERSKGFSAVLKHDKSFILVVQELHQVLWNIKKCYRFVDYVMENTDDKLCDR